MALTRGTRQVLNAARKETLRRYDARKTHRRQMEVFDRARSRAENVFKRGMADRLLAASGLDRASVERRLEIDREATHAFIRERAAEARREGKNALVRQRAHAREYFSRLHHRQAAAGLSPVSPPLTDILYTAHSIEVRDGLKSSTSIAHGRNIGRVLLFHDHHVRPFTFSVGSFRFAQILWNFVWPPPIEGEVTAAAFLLINGWRQVWCQPGCLSGGTAGANLAAGLSITQSPSVGPAFTVTKVPEVIYDTRVDKGGDESTGRIDVGGLDLQWVVNSDQPFPIDGLTPLVITVELLLTVDCRQSQSTLDLFEKDYQANAPGVILTLS